MCSPRLELPDDNVDEEEVLPWEIAFPMFAVSNAGVERDKGCVTKYSSGLAGPAMWTVGGVRARDCIVDLEKESGR